MPARATAAPIYAGTCCHKRESSDWRDLLLAEQQNVSSLGRTSVRVLYKPPCVGTLPERWLLLNKLPEQIATMKIPFDV